MEAGRDDVLCPAVDPSRGVVNSGSVAGTPAESGKFPHWEQPLDMSQARVSEGIAAEEGFKVVWAAEKSTISFAGSR